MKPISLSFRLAVWISALGILLVVAIMSFAYITLTQQTTSHAREHLRGKLEQVRHVLLAMPNSHAIASDTNRLNDVLIGHDELHIAISARGGTAALVSFSNIGKNSLLINRDEYERDPFFEWCTSDGKRLLSLIGTGMVKNGESVDVIVTLDRRADVTLQDSFLRAVVLALPIAIALVAVSAWWIAPQSLKPLFTLRKAIASVTTRDLSYRLPSNRFPNELRGVANSFNAMLARLEEGVSRLFQFSGDLAHEMRTPISNILGKTQVALSKTRSNDEYRSALESNAEELEHIIRLVEDMLFLAQTNNAQTALQRECVDLKQEVAHIADFFESVAEEKEVIIQIYGEGKVQADRLMIQRAISNLVSNAIRHTTRGKPVTVRIARDAGDTKVTVSNNGETIASEHLPHLFERLYRADRGRSRSQGGTGLGLAIVKSIMTLHGGRVSVESRSDGVTSFELVFQDLK